MPVEIDLREMDTADLSASMKTIYHDDVNAANTLEKPDNVGNAVDVCNGILHTTIRRHSVNMITIH